MSAHLRPALGLSFGYHDSAATLIIDENNILAEHEERFSRVKFDRRFPAGALAWLAQDQSFLELESVQFYEKPNLKRGRLVKKLISDTISSKRINPELINRIQLTSDKNFRLYINQQLNKFGISPKVYFAEHHLSHAASVFYTSKFHTSAILVIDGVGEKVSTSIWHGVGNDIKKLEEWKYPNSLGLFYACFALFCGFKVNSGEYKFMGLAPYGVPRYVDVIEQNFIQIFDDGNYRVNAKRLGLDNLAGFHMKSLESIFNLKARRNDELIVQKHADIAASVQKILDKAVLALARRALRISDSKVLCLSGGVALNCVANKNLVDNLGENAVNFFSASGDAGGSLGAAALSFLSLNRKKLDPNESPFRLNHNFSKLGRRFSKVSCRQLLEFYGIPFTLLQEREAARYLAQKIDLGAVVGVFSGPSEFGPRALGNRSIFADARIELGQIHLNQKIKFRESFRPFAPIVLSEYANDYFKMSSDSPFMLRTVEVREFSRDMTPTNQEEVLEIQLRPLNILNEISSIKSKIPGVTHLDGSARVQTINSADTSFSRTLLEEFYEVSQMPVLINTSFNVRGEPMVSSPEDALNCFMTTGIDFLYLEGLVVDKNQVSNAQKEKFVSKVEED